jgi:NADP-dependent 3-hydroxy acid dehydrogenase YdfG
LRSVSSGEIETVALARNAEAIGSNAHASPLLAPDRKQGTRADLAKDGIRVGSISPDPVISVLFADWLPEKLMEARESCSLLEASNVLNVVLFMLTRPRGMTIRDVVMFATNFDL